MLENLDAHQIARWKAYEIVNGPLDRTWDSEILAQIHELLQMQLKMAAQSKKDIVKVKRPWRTHQDEETEQEKAEREAREKQATLKAMDMALGFKDE